MKRGLIAVVTAALLFAWTAVAQKTATSEAQLGAIIHQAEVEGNFEAAIPKYKKFVADNNKNKALAAQALYHLGFAYEKLRSAEAQKVYKQVVSEYPGQTAAAEATKRLAALEVPSGAGLQMTRICSDAACKSDWAAVSPDGRFMGFSITNQPANQPAGLAIRNLSSGEVVWPEAARAATRGRPEALAFSPNARDVAYEWCVGGACELRIIPNSAGGKPRTAVPPDPAKFQHIHPAAWSSDGKSILASIGMNDTWQIAWVSASSGEVKPLRSLGWRAREVRPSLSFDGRYVAYAALAQDPGKTRFAQIMESLTGQQSAASLLDPPGADIPPDGEQHIYVLAADGSSAETVVVKGASTNESPVWTPEGNIVFISNRAGPYGLWSVAVKDGKAGAEPVAVKPDLGRAAVLGMTRLGAYFYAQDVRKPAQLEIRKLEGTAAQTGSRREPVSLVGTAPSWSRDGKQLAFLRQTKPALPIGNPIKPGNASTGASVADTLFVYSLETGDERRYPAALKTESGPLGAPRPLWFHNGKSVLVIMRDAALKQSLHRVDLKGGEFKQLSTSVPATAIVPGGLGVSDPLMALSSNDQMAYMIERGSEPLSGKDRLVALNVENGEERTVAMVSDPDAIILSADDRTAYLKVCEQTARPVPDPAVLSAFAGLAALARESGTERTCRRIVAVDLQNGQQTTVLALPASEKMGRFVLSPDNRRLAVVTGRDTPQFTSTSALIQLGVDGSAERKLYEMEVPPPLQIVSWTSDGTAITAIDWRARRQLRIPIDGRPPDVSPAPPQQGDFSPDGNYAVVSTPAWITGAREVWRIDNVSAVLKKRR